MFYDYLKNMFELIDGYNKNNNNIDIALKNNDNLIDFINNSEKIYNEDPHFDSFKYIKKGGSADELKRQMLDDRKNIIEWLNELKSQSVSSDKNNNLFKSAYVVKNLATLITEYVDMLNKLAEDSKLVELQSQLKDLNNIFDKYLKGQ